MNLHRKLPPPKRNKYGAEKDWRCLDCGAAVPKFGDVAPTICLACNSGRVEEFDSRAEARHYDMLRLTQAAGEISDLKVHPRFPLYIQGALLGEMEADFSFVVPSEGMKIQDIKGGKATDTPLSKWKRKHFTAQTGIPVEVVRR